MTSSNPLPGRRLSGATVLDSVGFVIGRVGAVYLEATSSQSTFITVATGRIEAAESFVPFHDVTLSDGQLQVAYTREQIETAPRIAAPEQLSFAEKERLYTHYGLTRPSATRHRPPAPRTPVTGPHLNTTRPSSPHHDPARVGG